MNLIIGALVEVEPVYRIARSSIINGRHRQSPRPTNTLYFFRMVALFT